MVKKAVKAEINAFVRGLITEASSLNFPENASFDEQNFELNRDGTRNRRYGLNYEYSYAIRDAISSYTSFSEDPITTFVWTNVGGNKDKDFLVVQIGVKLFIFDLNVVPLSSSGYVATVDISGIGALGKRHSMTSVDGKLIFAAGTGLIAVMTYDGSSFTITGERLKVRDQWGVAHAPTDDDPTLRPVSPPADYIYNLYNQSWGIPRRFSPTVATDFDDPIGIYTGTYAGKHPSNSEVVWTGISMQARPHPDSPYEMMYPTMYAEVLGSSTLAPRGYFIIDLLERGISRTNAVAANGVKYPELNMLTYSAKEDKTEGGASCVCEFAGRVFYSGFSGKVINGDAKSPDLSSYVVFSQLVRSYKDITKCYQEGDPTSRENNDIVDTDGGVIRVSGAENIQKLVNLGSTLMVFARNGVWAISGGSDYGFTATNYKVDKITNFGISCESSVVVEAGRAFYWSIDGIYAISKNQFGGYESVNITQTTIQTFYNNIPTYAKENVIGVYDSFKKKIRWVYRENHRFFLNVGIKELSLDLSLNAFTVFNLQAPVGKAASIIGIFDYEPINAVSDDNSKSLGKISTRYILGEAIASVPHFSIGYFNNTSFVDWKATNGVGIDAKAYLITGKITAGDSSVKKQIPYLVMHFKRTEEGLDSGYNVIHPSGCLIGSRWGFTTSDASNKWSSLFQAYKPKQAYIPTSTGAFDTGYEIVTSKNKIRGSGTAVSLYMETEPNKDCYIVGWNISLNGNSVT